MSAAANVRKVVTVLFCDLAGYTSTGDQIDPEALRSLQSRYFEDARAALERHGGTVEKFIGDAVMAVFGVPALHEDDALRAPRAPRSTTARGRARRLGFQARIGVNTGEVVAGAGDALVTGDAVNVAARLEQAAEPGEILLGETTLALARDAVEVEPVEPLRRKESQSLFRRTGLLRVVEGAPPSSVASTRRSLAAARNSRACGPPLTRRCAERALRLVTAFGPPGIGKTRLAREVAASLAAEADVLVGRCLPYGEGHHILAAGGDLPPGRRRGGTGARRCSARCAGGRRLGGAQVARGARASAAARARLRGHPLGRAAAARPDRARRDWTRDAPLLLVLPRAAGPPRRARGLGRRRDHARAARPRRASADELIESLLGRRELDEAHANADPRRRRGQPAVRRAAARDARATARRRTRCRDDSGVARRAPRRASRRGARERSSGLRSIGLDFEWEALGRARSGRAAASRCTARRARPQGADPAPRGDRRHVPLPPHAHPRRGLRPIPKSSAPISTSASPAGSTAAGEEFEEILGYHLEQAQPESRGAG